jgi:spheroidene monooxygenase
MGMAFPLRPRSVRVSLQRNPEGAMQTVSLSLFRFDGAAARLWVLGQMGAARLSFWRMPDVGFWKLCGSGTGEGFTPRPNWGVWAILAVWPDAATARRRVQTEAVYRRWRARAGESWTLYLNPLSARGRWSGVEPFAPTPQEPDGPIAALTRASIRPARALRFWDRVPDISAVIGQDPNVIFKIGVGEVPLLHQVTFSIWPDAASMAAFARGGGPHGQAIRAVREGNWFKEELYARFRIAGASGTWGGMNPLSRADPRADGDPEGGPAPHPAPQPDRTAA